jgi:hypothetical protein
MTIRCHVVVAAVGLIVCICRVGGSEQGGDVGRGDYDEGHGP